jgi:TatD DNase family protein
MFDSHCHLTDPAYAPDLPDVLRRAQAAEVRGVVTIASNADDADAAHALATQFDSIWCTAGIHPHEASTTERDFDRIREAVRRPLVVAVGETGLDYHYDNSPRDAQRRSFDRHIALAEETRLPLIVHSRDAEDDILAAMRAASPGVLGVLHCFSGSRTLLEAALEAGWYVSFAGMVTFKKFSGGDLLRSVPQGRLLLETDGPYLAPVPHRGKRNEPAWLAATCEAAARIRGESVQVLAAGTEANARRFYRID